MVLIIFLLCVAILIQYAGIPAPVLRVVQVVLAVLILFLLAVLVLGLAGDSSFWLRR